MCAQRRLRSAWASAQSDQNQRCPPEANVGPKLPTECTVKTQIRMGGCPGWAESSLGTNVILLVLSLSGSKCFICNIYTFHHIFTFRIEPNMKSFNHANNIVLRREIYIHSLTDQTFLSCKRNMVCSNSAVVWLVKDDCAVGSAVLGKRGYNPSSTQSMELFHSKPTEKKVFWADRKRSNGFSMMCVMLQAVFNTAEKEFRTIVFLIFDASCWHKKAPIRHKRWNNMIFHPVHYKGKCLQSRGLF